MSEPLIEERRRDYLEPEIAQMHEQLVVKVGEVRNLREQKNSMVAKINSQIKESEKDVWDLQKKLETGYEMVEVEVLTLMDTPQPGWKRMIWADNNEKLRDLPMSPRERQMQMFDNLPDISPEAPNG